ncbi:gamma-glutamylcyclotransferase family protein [Paraclostridium sordellii]|uniref:gamma-glutamylcyclotransferase family protein n=1 Tax=Paraclostridium sordellii TaxID=1505 RepID=UPI00070E884C|nr:gamma-glutamylcyclotransferase family protein [Paeniclostridium sordellii]
MKCKMFVYGTLMKGYHNYDKYLKHKALSHKKAYIEGCMYHLPSKKCPAVIYGKDKVYGQVIEIKDDENGTTLKEVDYLERYFDGSDEIMYTREVRDVYYEDGTIEKINVYIFKNDKFLKDNETIYIKNGNWHDYNLKK